MFHGRAYAGGRFVSMFRFAYTGTPGGTPIPHSTLHRDVTLDGDADWTACLIR
jgi:hypothetical protein